jgi:hypothetical protein
MVLVVDAHQAHRPDRLVMAKWLDRPADHLLGGKPPRELLQCRLGLGQRGAARCVAVAGDLGVAQQPQHRGRVAGRVDRPQPQPRGGQHWNLLRPMDTGIVVSLHRSAP